MKQLWLDEVIAILKKRETLLKIAGASVVEIAHLAETDALFANRWGTLTLTPERLAQKAGKTLRMALLERAVLMDSGLIAVVIVQPQTLRLTSIVTQA